MPFTNLDYLYDHLPARFRRDDLDLFLQRFLMWISNELDGVDESLDTFWQKIQPVTAPEEFIQWWLWSLFGWGFFPRWLKGDQLRGLYAGFAQHLARRGTARGTLEFLAAFGVKVIVDSRPRVWGEAYWGESGYTIDGPLCIVIRVLPEVTPGALGELRFWSESFWGDATPGTPTEGITRADVMALLRFQWPVGNFVFLHLLRIGPGQEQADLNSLPLYGDVLYGE